MSALKPVAGLPAARLSEAMREDPPAVRKRGYSPQETAEATGLSLATVHRGIRDGSIPSKKYKNRRIISDETIERLVAPNDNAA
jgi:hypothetical protein